MKTKEELDALKEEVETLNKKLAELTGDELAQVAGGSSPFPHTAGFNSWLKGDGGSVNVNEVLT